MDKKSDELRNEIKLHKSEIEQLEDEMFEPGADAVSLNEQIESARQNIRNCVDELANLGYDDVIDELSEDLKKIGVEPKKKEKGIMKFLGTKLSKALKQHEKRLKEYANRNKENLLNKAKSITRKRDKIDIPALIAALAMIGIAGNELQKVLPIEKNPIERPGIEDQNIEDSKDLSDGFTFIEDQDGGVHYIETSLVYTAYRVANNSLGIVNFRNEPSTKNGDVVLKLPVGSTVFIKGADASINGDGNHDWRQAVYYNEDTGEHVNGYIDAKLLEEKDSNSVSILVKDKEIDSIPDEEQASDQTQIFEFKPYQVNAQVLNLRGKPSTETGEVLSKLEKGNTVFVNHNTELMNSDSEHKWQKVMYFDSEKNEYVEGYIDINWATEKQGISSYEDVEITDEDIEKLVDYKNSWENQGLYEYLKGYSSDYNNFYVKNFITEDGKYYICQGDVGLDNGAKNFGFGVMVNQWGEPNNQVVGYFKEKGYDVTNPDLLQIGEAKIPVEVVDYVSEMYMRETIDTIKQCLQNKDVKFSKQEILALAGICYQFGRDESFINRFIDYYIQYGGNTEEFKNNYITPGGSHPLIKVQGASDPHFGYNRGTANWKAFHDGDFIMGAGPVAIVHFDEELEQDVVDVIDYDER